MTYTPTTATIRAEYAGRVEAWEMTYAEQEAARAEEVVEFDRWLRAHDAEFRAQALREREQQMRLAEEFAATTGRGLAEWLAVVEALSGPPDTPRAEQTKEDR